MPLEIKKEERENPRKLVRRFCQAVRQSGILKRSRSSRFRHRPLSKTKKKMQALRREEIKEGLKKSEKLGG